MPTEMNKRMKLMFWSWIFACRNWTTSNWGKRFRKYCKRNTGTTEKMLIEKSKMMSPRFLELLKMMLNQIMAGTSANTPDIRYRVRDWPILSDC